MGVFDWRCIGHGVAANLVVNTLGWAASCAYSTDLLYDAFGALAHVSTVICCMGCTPHVLTFPVLVAGGMVITWAIRLGSFLLLRILARGGDDRLAAFKNKPVKFGVLWLLQAVWVANNCAPLLAMLGSGPKAAALGWFDLVAMTVWVGGFLIETIADEQKRRFRVKPTNGGQFIRTGLWAQSRHPNYFGEIVLWVGFALFCAPRVGVGTHSLLSLTLLSPLLPAVLLLKVSGVPLLESKARRKWGSDPEFQQYLQRTPVLV
eukprot:RCo041083